MKQILICLLATGLLLNPSDSQPFRNGDVVGFFGDSITHAEYSEVNYTHVLYNYYVTHKPEEEIELRELGIGGIQIEQALDLYEKDPAVKGLNKAVFEYGINDLKRYYYEDPVWYSESEEAREENLEDYKEDLRKFLSLVEKEGIEKEDVFITTVAIPDFANFGEMELEESQVLVQEGFEKISEAAREVAKEESIGLIEFREGMTILTEDVSGGVSETDIMLEDMLHPNTNGQIYLAYLFLEQQGALQDVSFVEIQKGRIRSDDAKVSNLHYKEDYLYYDYQPRRLPMGVSGEYFEADSYLNILDKMNREMIQIHGLDETAVYDIYVTGEKVGSFCGAEFEDGVNIANIRENPSQKWARNVEQMNRGRRVAELAYRKEVQNSTDCGSGLVTEEELAEKYELWKDEDEAYRRGMYELAQERIKITERVAVIRQGAEAPEEAFAVPGRNYKKLIFAATPIIVVGAGVVFFVRRKRKVS